MRKKKGTTEKLLAENNQAIQDVGDEIELYTRKQLAVPTAGLLATEPTSCAPVTIAWDMVSLKTYTEAQCTPEEVSAATGIPIEELAQFEKEMAAAGAAGRAKLRKALFDRAVGGVDALGIPIAPQKEVAVWLSKQYLDMKDKAETKHDGEIKLTLEKL